MKKNRLLFTLLMVLCITYIYFYGGKVPYMLVNIMISLVSVSFVYTFIIYIRFKYSQDIDKKSVVKGEKVNFLFNISNEDFLLYPYIKVTLFGSDTIFAKQLQTRSFSLVPFTKRSHSFELECKYRGVYEIGIKSIEFEDFLGIFKFKYKVASETKTITVYPKIVHLNRFYLQTDFLSETHSILDSKVEDLNTISDIRNYRYGDSMKKIHWKLTAKSREMMVKNFQSTSETHAVILLDLKKNDYDTDLNTILEDKVLESAVSVIYYCLSNWIPISLVYYKDNITTLEARTPFDFEDIYKILSKISFSENVEIKDILNVYLNDNFNKTNFLIFTSNLDYDLYSQLYKAKFSGNDVSLIHTSPDELTGIKHEDVSDILTSLPEIGVSTYNININDDVKLILDRS